MQSHDRPQGLLHAALLSAAFVLAAAGGCAPEDLRGAPVALLTTHFPKHAEQVLGVAAGTALVAAPAGGGFVPAPLPGLDPVTAAEATLAHRRGLRVVFPARGDGVVRIRLPDGFAITVRELGLSGAGRLVRGAAAYDQAHGEASFWRATNAGLEEWLLVRARTETSVAWEVTGATLRQRGGVIEVVDHAGATRLTVAAPAAFTEGDQPVRPLLAAAGTRITLTLQGPAGNGLVLIDPVWQVTGSMATGRSDHTATLLPSGQVLLAGGLDAAGTLASSELYDLAAGAFAPTTAPLATARYGHTATLLPSSHVLLTGGFGSTSASSVLASAELFFPLTKTYAPTPGSLATARVEHTATVLLSGKVLVVGGYGSASRGSLDSAEVYDPSTGTFAPAAGSLATARACHTATLLPSGKVLIAGGCTGGSCFPSLASAELYDPATGTFAPATGELATARHNHTATLLPSGSVLIAGGGTWGHPTWSSFASAELYDPATDTFAPTTTTLTTARSSHTATLLPSGQVLLAGGYDGSTTFASAELYDPETAEFAAVPDPLVSARVGHTATLLPSGEILMAGGSNGGGTLPAAELYDPAAGTFTTSGSLATGTWFHTATLLPSGQVLVTGGAGLMNGAALYDPDSGTLTPTGPMSAVRSRHTATLLPSGKVVIVAGEAPAPAPGASLASAELYDPAADSFTPTAGRLATPRLFHTATLLPSGKVLVVGGAPLLPPSPSDSPSAELYDPATDTFRPTIGALATARAMHTATLLPSGKVLVAGGARDSGAGVEFLASAELYDPTADTFAPTAGALTTARALHTATLLPSGKVLLAAGSAGASAEIFDPAAGTFAPTAGPLATARWYHKAALLPSGKVLVAGGNGPGDVHLTSAELYDSELDAFTSVGPLTAARSSHTLTLLLSGGALAAGGLADAAVLPTELFDDGRGAPAATSPTLAGPLPDVTPGAALSLSGTRFTGVSEASGGTTQSSATNYPLVLLWREDSDAVAWAGVTAFSATSASAVVPATVIPGPYVAWVVVNGALSNGQPLTVAGWRQGTACVVAPQCASGLCVDGVCCDTPCSGSCERCDQPGSVGACGLVPDGEDPRLRCAGPSGGSPSCAGACQSGLCAFPGLSTPCGLCAGCDGAGRCAATPSDDSSCGTVACSGLDSMCRSYADLTTNRCAALGVCKSPDDPASCTSFTDLPCDGGAHEDSGPPPADGPDDVDAALVADGGAQVDRGPPTADGPAKVDAALVGDGGGGSDGHAPPSDGTAGDVAASSVDAGDHIDGPPHADGGGGARVDRGGCGCVVGGPDDRAGWLVLGVLVSLVACRGARRRQRAAAGAHRRWPWSSPPA